MSNKKIYSILEKRITSFLIMTLLLGVLTVTPLSQSQDTTPPQIIDVRDFPDPVGVGDNINIDCTVIDNMAVGTVSVLIFSPIDSPINYSMTKIPGSAHGYYFTEKFSAPGAYAYIVWAQDLSGNTNQSNQYFFTVKDLSPPNVTLLYPTGGEIVNGIVNIQWIATDAFDPNLDGGITLRYSFDGGTIYQTLISFLNNTGTYNWDTTTYLDANTYKIRVDATDDDENTGQDSSDSVFTVDNTPPETTIAVTGTLGENNWYIDNVTVTLNATDETSGLKSTQYRLGNGSWVNYTGPFPLTMDGNHTLEYYSLDNGDTKEATKSENIKVDTNPPQVTFHKPRDRYFYIFDREIIRTLLKTVVIGKLTIEVNINENGSGVERVNFDVDGETRILDTEEPFEWLYDEPALLRHRHTLSIGAQDFAGHTGAATELSLWVLNI
jgi:hypothetical protein